MKRRSLLLLCGKQIGVGRGKIQSQILRMWLKAAWEPAVLEAAWGLRKDEE